MMKTEARIVSGLIKRITRVICSIEDNSLHQIPLTGPLIIVSNHVNFLDVPILYTHLMPRPLTGFAKVETWDSPPMAYLFNLWGAIPIQRGEPDVRAIRRCLEALEAGWIFAIAPEGTRSGNGILGPGNPGVVLLAMQSKAPLLPLVFYGHENYKAMWNRLQRIHFHIRVGQPFLIDTGGYRANHQIRQSITNEIMYQLAALLPPRYRGQYNDLSCATNHFIIPYDEI
jgi:1-acyl-sn-glycerol-3-phosphate acyltransferase